MASTYVDNFAIVDAINTQSPSAAQYNSNEGIGTLNKDNYLPTSLTTHTIPAGVIELPTGAILDDGYSQKALYELLTKIVVNWDCAMASLDDSAGVAGTTFVSTAAITNLDGNYSTAFAGGAKGIALGIDQNKRINLEPNGMSTRGLAILCQAIATQTAVATALCDADSTLTDTNYGATCNILFTCKNGYAPPLTSTDRLVTTDAFNICDGDDTSAPNPSSRITVKGIAHEALVSFLQTVVTNHNALWVKLDADI